MLIAATVTIMPIDQDKGVQPVVTVMAPPNRKTGMAETKATNSDGTERARRRVIASRNVINPTAISARTAYSLKPSLPGRMMINTPMNPTSMALHRRQPTASPKNIAANIVTVSGNDCKMALTLANGICAKALRNNIVEASSAKARVRITRQFRQSMRINRLLRK